MIELPEAVVIAGQMTEELKGKRIAEGIRGNAPHKFAFYSREPQEYEAILRGKTMGEAYAQGSMIFVSVEPDHVLVLGEGGERIRAHRDESTLPKKHQLLLEFTDGTYLTVSVQGWGAALLLHKGEVAAHPIAGRQGVSPVGEEFTLEYLEQLFRALKPGDSRSIKFFMISEPGVMGVGNGYLQDILFRAKIHPKRRAAEVKRAERRRLYTAVKRTLKEAVELGGRDTEHDLYDHPGRYKKMLDSRSVGQPCRECGTQIEKIQYLGGACYFCPACQT